MCGRMTLFTPTDVLETRFGADAVASIPPRYNIAPREDVVVIRNDAPEEIRTAEWGFRPEWVEDPVDWSHPINARAETVAEKPTFREAFETRRCLVLADGFYEWAPEPGGKQPYWVSRPDGEPFAMAGLWARWHRDGDSLETATVLTTEPNDVVAPLHDRMAVLLEPDEEDRWLSEAAPEALRGLLDPYPDDDLVAHPVSKAVNDPGVDRPDLIEPVDPGRQSGLGDFA